VGIRDHLIRKPTVDVNGRQTTVLVKIDKPAFARTNVLSMKPRASTTYMNTIAPTAMHRAQLALIAEADYDLREKMAADINRNPAALEILGSDLDPAVRNIVSKNPAANAQALSNVVTQESNPFGLDEDFDDLYQSDSLLNVALHANVDYPTLVAVSNISENNNDGAAIARARMNGQFVSDPRMAYAS